MIGKGVFRENFQPQSCSGRKAPKTGQMKGNFENIVIIDTDSDQVDDVVIIDLDEFVHQKSHGSSVPSRDRTCTHQSVISVDDDDESDDDGIIAEGVGELDSDASSSKRVPPAPSRMQNSVHIDVDDSQVYKKDFASNTQKSRETCTAKATGRNRYGLDGSETESSESDCSDCEVLEVCEQWEKASVKRKRHVFNDKSCYDEHPSSSGFHSNIYVDIEMEKRAEQHAGSPLYSGPSKGKYVKENQPTFSSKADSQVDGIHFNLGTENPFRGSDQKVDQESFKSFGSESVEEMQSFPRSSDIEHEERTRGEDISLFTNYKNDSFCGGVSGDSGFEKELGGKESNFMTSSQEACEIQVDNKGSAVGSKDDNLSEAKSNCTFFEERPVNCDGLVLRAQDVGRTASNERDIINEREKLKETDEYKRANEEEWASRHRQLQIQVIHICRFVNIFFLCQFTLCLYMSWPLQLWAQWSYRLRRGRSIGV